MKGSDTFTKWKGFNLKIDQDTGGVILTLGYLGKRLRVLGGSPYLTLVSPRRKGFRLALRSWESSTPFVKFYYIYIKKNY